MKATLDRFKLGNMEATVISDGTLPLGKPGDAFLGLTQDDIRRQLTDNFLPPDNIVLEQNILVLNTGKQVVLSSLALLEAEWNRRTCLELGALAAEELAASASRTARPSPAAAVARASYVGDDASRTAFVIRSRWRSAIDGFA